MRLFSSLIILSFILHSCGDSDTPQSDYTGRSVSYALFAGYDGGVPGTVEFKERVDKSVDIIIRLDDLEGDARLPAHLHFGDLSEADNAQAAMLNVYDVQKGESLTNLRELADDTLFPFDRVSDFDGSIKVHLGPTGDDYNIIVSAGNIGANESLGFNMQSMSICSPDLIEK